MQRQCVILVDGSNAYATAKHLGYSVDYKKVLEECDIPVLKAFYFTALIEGQVSFVQPLVDYLSYNNWTTVTKPASEFLDPITGRMKIKGNMDIEIATIAFEMAQLPQVTDLYLFSGDGDFRYMIESLQRRYGLRVTVVSTIQTKPPMCSDVLRRQADTFLDMADANVRKVIEHIKKER